MGVVGDEEGEEGLEGFGGEEGAGRVVGVGGGALEGGGEEVGEGAEEGFEGRYLRRVVEDVGAVGCEPVGWEGVEAGG